MKLAKFIKNFDSVGIDVKLFNQKGDELFSGRVLDFSAAADFEGDRELYLKECAEDGDFDAIAAVHAATSFLNCKLSKRSPEGEVPVYISVIKNKYGVNIPTLMIELEV